MFRRGGFFISLVAVLLVVGLLAAGGYWLFQAGQAQGYALGMAAGPSSGAEAAPGSPAAPGLYPGYPGWMFYGRPHFGFFPFPFFGLFCLGAIFFFFLFVLSPLRWRRWGHHPGYWYGGKGGPWGPPPWAREEQAPGGEAAPEGEPNRPGS